MKNLCVLLLILLVVFCVENAFTAGLEVSVTGGNWTISATQGTGYTSTNSPNTWTVTGSSDGYENITIKSETGDGAWTNDMYGNIGVNKYALKLNSSTGQVVYSNPTTLVTNLAKQATTSFGLWFGAPTTGTADTTKVVLITLTASNWLIAPYVNGANWVRSPAGGNCTQACTGRGGVASVSVTAAQQLAAVNALAPFPSHYDYAVSANYCPGTNCSDGYCNVPYATSGFSGNWDAYFDGTRPVVCPNNNITLDTSYQPAYRICTCVL